MFAHVSCLQVLGAAVVATVTWGVKHVEQIHEVVPSSTIFAALVTGIALMSLAAIGYLGLCMSKGSCGRVLLRLYAAVLFVLMVAFLAIGGTLVYAAKYLVRRALLW